MTSFVQIRNRCLITPSDVTTRNTIITSWHVTVSYYTISYDVFVNEVFFILLMKKYIPGGSLTHLHGASIFVYKVGQQRMFARLSVISIHVQSYALHASSFDLHLDFPVVCT